MNSGAGIEALAKFLERSSKILVFTGAGISTASGIPDYRGPQGVWKKRTPVYFEDFLRSDQARIEHWDYMLEHFETFKNARPNAAHLSLVELERLEKLLAVVTQNIDGLHKTAGNNPKKIIELHGTCRHVECLSCGRLTEPAPAFDEFRKTRQAPLCSSCGGFLNAAIVMFGQGLPQNELQKAFDLAKEADLIVALGSTLEIEPAASVPLAGYSKGTPYIIINRGPTAHDHLATLRFEEDLTVVLPQAVSLLKTHSR